MKRYIAITCILLLLILAGCKVEEIPEEKEEIISPEEEAPAAIEEEIPEEVEEPTTISVRLTTDKQMIPSEIKIKKGTTVIWTNEDEYPHNIMIYDKADPDLKEEDIIRSQNFYQNESFEYTFNKRGTFVIKDVYSGPMRGTITASVVAEIKIMGTIVVE